MDLLNGDEAYAVSDFAINGFMRVVTDPRIPADTSFEVAREFAENVGHQPHALVVHAGRGTGKSSSSSAATLMPSATSSPTPISPHWPSSMVVNS
ncbi:hypothetical protein [Nonomuraea sp. NPDC049709]|uniref:hypothetical protein n=1 Tax=Nonomuraea sp. NPDC049709 TaxID=3154736 RepID=UPI00341BFC09